MLVAENIEMNGTPEGCTGEEAFGRPLGLSGPVSFKSKGGARYFYGAFSLSEWLTGLSDPTGDGHWERKTGVLILGSLFHAQPGCLLCLRKPEHMS